jgi:hypothetical protein
LPIPEGAVDLSPSIRGKVDGKTVDMSALTHPVTAGGGELPSFLPSPPMGERGRARGKKFSLIIES